MLNPNKCNLKRELALGIKMETEHSHLFKKNMQKIMSKKIASDHIKEYPCYYSRGLVPMEKRLKGGNIK